MRAIIIVLLPLCWFSGTMCEASEQPAEVSIHEQVSAIKRFYKYIEQKEIPTVVEFSKLMGHHNEFEFMFEDSEMEKNTPDGRSVFFHYLQINKNWFYGDKPERECELAISYPLAIKDDVVKYEVLTVCNNQVVSRVIIYTTRFKEDIKHDGYISSIEVRGKDIADIIKEYNPNPELYREK
ncbi:MAG: hypothetical protein HZA22_06280 [Nitrospirae bacterium]|nr:hypothetical protein [Nitrospirota bacterium]